MLVLEQNNSKKEQVNKNITKLDTSKNRKYKVEAIRYNAV